MKRNPAGTTATSKPSGPRSAKHANRNPGPPPPALPHERDETTEAPVPPRKVIKQAAQDVDAGLIDTDNYTRASAVAAVAPGRKRRGR